MAPMMTPMLIRTVYQPNQPQNRSVNSIPNFRTQAAGSGWKPSGRSSSVRRSFSVVGEMPSPRMTLRTYHQPPSAPVRRCRPWRARRPAAPAAVAIAPPGEPIGRGDHERQQQGEGLGEQGKPGDDADCRRGATRQIPADDTGEEHRQHGDQEREEVVIVQRRPDVQELRHGERDE